VGGETLRYEDVEVDEDELSEEAFDRLRERWPMGRLGRLLGLARPELLRLPRARSVLIRWTSMPRQCSSRSSAGTRPIHGAELEPREAPRGACR
jgi:hypothetical protein